MWASAVKLIQRKKGQSPPETGFHWQKVEPGYLLCALALSSPSIFHSRLPLAPLLCLLSAQVSNTSSEQWPIVLYWAALVSLPLPLLLPSIYLPWLFFLPLTLFLFIVFPLLGGLVAEMEKKGRTKQQRKRMSEGCRVLYRTLKEKKKKRNWQIIKRRRWREMWNNGKWKTARWLLENGGLDRE